MDRFADRTNAGQMLAQQLLTQHTLTTDTLITGLVRGGVPVAAAIADTLSLPLDILLVRKLGLPSQKELAMGAITVDGNYVLNDFIIHSAEISDQQLQQAIKEEMDEMVRRAKRYQCDSWHNELNQRPVILVDDGIATGATMQAAVQFMQRQGANPISIAAPVISESALALFKPLVSHLYYLCLLEPYHSVGAWYDDFTQVDDDQVCQLLRQHDLIKRADRDS